MEGLGESREELKGRKMRCKMEGKNKNLRLKGKGC